MKYQIIVKEIVERTYEIEADSEINALNIYEFKNIEPIDEAFLGLGDEEILVGENFYHFNSNKQRWEIKK